MPVKYLIASGDIRQHAVQPKQQYDCCIPHGKAILSNLLMMIEHTGHILMHRFPTHKVGVCVSATDNVQMFLASISDGLYLRPG